LDRTAQAALPLGDAPLAGLATTTRPALLNSNGTNGFWISRYRRDRLAHSTSTGYNLAIQPLPLAAGARMHTVEMLEHALRAARKAGYQLREEWLGGSGGGACVLRGKKQLFLDLAQSPAEHLAHAVAALRSEPLDASHKLPPELRALLECEEASVR
jgi:hypothetical protein